MLQNITGIEDAVELARAKQGRVGFGAQLCPHPPHLRPFSSFKGCFN